MVGRHQERRAPAAGAPASKRTLFVHVGLPKAGSSSIQSMLADWALPLEHRGVHVPVSGRTLGGGARLYRMSGGRLVPAPGVWTDLLRELTDCAVQRFAISWEGFTHGLSTPSYARNCAADVAALASSAGVDVQVVGYVRPQYQRVESEYAQKVKMGRETRPFDAVVEEYAGGERLDYNRIFAPWRAAFGQRVRVRPLQCERMPDGLLADFLGVIGAADLAGAAASRPPRNRRLGAKHLEALRLVAAALIAARNPEPQQLALELEGLRWQVPALLDGDVPFAGLDHGQVEALSNRFAESNAKLARDYAVDSQGVLFRAPDDGLARPVRAELSAAELMRLARFVRDKAGVELATMPAFGAPSTRSRQPLARFGLGVGPRPVARAWVGALRRQAGQFLRDFLGSRDLHAYLRRLRWELEIPCRRLLRKVLGRALPQRPAASGQVPNGAAPVVRRRCR